MRALEQEIPSILAQAAEWRLAALLLSRPRPGWPDEVDDLAREVRDEGLKGAARAARGASEGAYHALLGAGGAASPRAAAHAGFRDPGRILADLAARYAAFGFSPRADEPDDHLAVECDFVAYLFMKEAYARVRGLTEAADVTREARAGFLADHVAVAGHRLARKLPEDAPAHLLGAARFVAMRLPAATSEEEPSSREEDPLGGDCASSCGACPR